MNHSKLEMFIARFRYYCITKHKVPEYLKCHIVYDFCWTACNSKCIGKIDQNFGPRVQEHSGLNKKSPVYNHLVQRAHFNYVVNLDGLPLSRNLVNYLGHVKIVVYWHYWQQSKLVWIIFFRQPSHEMEETKIELWH